jgi:hypothetical protein
MRTTPSASQPTRTWSGTSLELLTRPVGRPSHKALVEYKSFLYQAASWKKARRVVAKVEHHQGELFPRVGFIVTNLSLPSRAVVRFYNRRGTAEQWIKEGKQATHWTRLSCQRFRANEVRLQLSVLAYNLGNLWRRLVLPKRIDHWSLTSLQQRLVKTGGRLVRHARYYWLLLAEGHLTRAGVRGYSAADLGAAGACWLESCRRKGEKLAKEAGRGGEPSEKSQRTGSAPSWLCRKGYGVSGVLKRCSATTSGRSRGVWVYTARIRIVKRKFRLSWSRDTTNTCRSLRKSGSRRARV